MNNPLQSVTTQDQPLGMTIHNLPTAGPLLVNESTRTKQGRLKMIVVLLMCAAPVIASYFTYYVIRPEGRRNFGELINPQRALPDLVVTSLTGQSVNLSTLKGQWLLVTVAEGACDEMCSRHLYLQRQLRESLGKDKDRLDRVWLVTDMSPIDSALLPALKEATVLRVPQTALANWLMPAVGESLSAHLYLVDPVGNWMMRFPARLDQKLAASAKRDLERLMRASASWDTAGRDRTP